MGILHPPQASSAQFHWTPGSPGSYVAEISDLGPNFRMGRVYDDACDEGLTLVSQRTGREVVFVVDRTVERDGDVMAWELIPARIADQGKARMVLFND